MNRYILIGLIAFLSFGASAAQQQSYPSENAAVEAFVDALASSDEEAMAKVLGSDWRKFIPPQDRENVYAFLAAWSQGHRVVNQGPDRAILEVGTEGWTLPVPMVKRAAGWQFDTPAGAEEMRTRRIGRNELSAMQASLAYFDAQKEYARVDRDGDGVLQYAQNLISSRGTRDGLYWPSQAGEAESPLGPLIATRKPGEGYHGYRYKILKAQGKDAPGGAYDYVIKGRMVSGFALIARPVRYGDTGVMSFIVSHDGQVYEKDLGPNSESIAAGLTVFNPDASWKKVDVPPPGTSASTMK